jgi:hypothetical protein
MNMPSHAHAACAVTPEPHQIAVPNPPTESGNPVVPLSQLAHFFVGFDMADASKDTDQKCFLLQAHELADGVLPEAPARAVIANLPPGQVLRAGDIILLAGSSDYHTIVLAAPAPDTVCAAPLLVIRLHDAANMNPAWLCCFLHTAASKRLLCHHAAQAEPHEGMLEALHLLRVPLPSPDVQQTLLQMAAQFRVMEQQAHTALYRLKQANEAIWLALARGVAVAGTRS